MFHAYVKQYTELHYFVQLTKNTESSIGPKLSQAPLSWASSSTVCECSYTGPYWLLRSLLQQCPETPYGRKKLFLPSVLSFSPVIFVAFLVRHSGWVSKCVGRLETFPPRLFLWPQLFAHSFYSFHRTALYCGFSCVPQELCNIRWLSPVVCSWRFFPKCFHEFERNDEKGTVSHSPYLYEVFIPLCLWEPVRGRCPHTVHIYKVSLCVRLKESSRLYSLNWHNPSLVCIIISSKLLGSKHMLSTFHTPLNGTSFMSKSRLLIMQTSPNALHL